MALRAKITSRIAGFAKWMENEGELQAKMADSGGQCTKCCKLPVAHEKNTDIKI